MKNVPGVFSGLVIVSRLFTQDMSILRDKLT